MPKRKLNLFENTLKSRRLKGKMLAEILKKRLSENMRGNYSYLEISYLRRVANGIVSF